MLKLIVNLLGKTARAKIDGFEKIEKAKAKWGSVIYCIWHGKMLYPVYLMKNRGIYAIVSRHRDGEIAARLLSSMGYNLIRGSSTRGGTRAIMEAIKCLKEGKDVVFVGDGPKGPPFKLKAGCIYAAAKSGKPVICASFAARPVKKLSSWDKFALFPPFSKIYVKISDPFVIPSSGEKELEKWREKIEAELIRLDQEVEQNV